MGRGKKRQAAGSTTSRPTGMSYDDIQKSTHFASGAGPNWRSPGQFYIVEAESFISPDHEADGGLPLDRAVALRLLKFPFRNPSPQDVDFWGYHRWYYPLTERRFFHAAEAKTEREQLLAERDALREEYRRRKEAGEDLAEIGEQGKTLSARIEELTTAIGRPYLAAPFMSPEDTCPGMTAAAKDLLKSIAADETIAVWCDYDVDGTTAGEVLRRAIAPYGAKTLYGWADAKAGFGVSQSFIKSAAEQGAKTLVTLDCGSGAVDAITLAKSLGMKTIVVDHHSAEDAAKNPADHHLNPNRFEVPTSPSTGAQLSWKFGAAIQMEKEGQVRDDYWEEPLYLAGLGCYADMGSVNLHENRAFFWLANEHAPIGVRELAKEIGEETNLPGQMVRTQACLNLAKRMPSVATSDVGGLMAAQTVEEARPFVDKLLTSYNAAQAARKEIVELALEQTGRAQHDYGSGKIDRPHPDEPFAIAVIEDQAYGDFIGYTGPVASNVSRATGKPAIIFIRNGDDVKFSGRNDSKVPIKLGDLIEDPALKAACTVTIVDEDGIETEDVNLGGHTAVVSGRCKPENIDAVKDALAAFAKQQKVWFPPEDKQGPKAPYVQESLVDPTRLTAIEKQSQRLSPFSSLSMPVYFKPGEQVDVTWNSEVQVSIAGHLAELTPDPDSEKYLAGQLVLTNGDKREVRYPVDEPLPQGDVQWLLRVGKPGPYYLRRFGPLPESLR
jgi:single-stranded DNA-specific DHH superfamily exonuclease